jgi:very-short-patch-repair endonuclease
MARFAAADPRHLDSLPQVWRIRRVEHDAGDKSDRRPVEIPHVLKAGESGLATVESVAEPQSGVIHRQQLHALGLDRHAVARRMQSGRLVVVFASVLSVGGHALDEVAWCHAALLHAGTNSVLSHGTAAALWGLVDHPPAVHRVTIIARHARDERWLRVHRVQSLDARDVRMLGRLPVTAPARTLIDHAGQAPGAVAEEALARARALGLVTDWDLEGALKRAPLRSGVRNLRRLLREPIGQAVTFSRFERDLIRLLGRAGLPLPRFNVLVAGHRVDAAWDEHKLVLECDGWEFHRDRRSFESDRRRDQDQLAAGYGTVRITWRHLHEEPARIIELLTALLLPDPSPPSR